MRLPLEATSVLRPPPNVTSPSALPPPLPGPFCASRAVSLPTPLARAPRLPPAVNTAPGENGSLPRAPAFTDRACLRPSVWSAVAVLPQARPRRSAKMGCRVCVARMGTVVPSGTAFRHAPACPAPPVKMLSQPTTRGTGYLQPDHLPGCCQRPQCLPGAARIRQNEPS